jgi:hypothetical protein
VPERSANETIDIESAGGAVSVILGGATIVSLHIRGDATAEYQWDARPRGGSWIQNIGTEHTGQSDYDEVFETGVEEVRIRCSTGTGGSGDTADVYLSAGGG